MSQRILVISASVGAGHLRAAEAVEAALHELAPDAIVKNIDAMDYTNSTFRRLYARTYLDLVNTAPHVLGYFYDLMNRGPTCQERSDRLRLMVEKLNLHKFIRLLKSETWDVVINAHFLSAELIASLRRKEQFTTPQFTVTTDFETHRLWVNSPCDHYFTATDEGAANLQTWGVPAADISVTGIPIHPVFSRPKPRDECLKRQGLVGDRPIILQLSGGFGVGPIEHLVQQVLSVEQPLELVVVAGRNEELKRQLEQVVPPERHRIHVLGFTREMDELLNVADVVVSKPGGLTTSETLARGAVMAVVNPIPGQESRNSDFLLENGAAIKINSTATLPFKLNQLLADQPRLARLKENARRLAKPRAAFDVAQFALDWLARGGVPAPAAS